MTTNEKIARIRQLMARDQVQAVIIPSGDPHMSEYFSEHWKTRRFVSGFTGSVGTYVITENASGLWVDGRYYVQAERQIADSEAVLFRASEPDCPTFSQYLLDNLAPNSVVGLNGKLFSLSMMEQMQQLFAQKGITLNIQADYGNAFTVFSSPIDFSIRVAEHPIGAASIFAYEPNNPAAKAYSAVAQEVLSYGQK